MLVLDGVFAIIEANIKVVENDHFSFNCTEIDTIKMYLGHISIFYDAKI